jgi:cytidine deaminase
MLDREPIIKLDYPKERITNQEFKEALAFYEEHRPAFIKSAALCRDKAYSYREVPFKVGCAMVTISPNVPKGEYEVYQSYNFTPSGKLRKDWRKRCAERSAVHAAIDKKVKYIVALVTVSGETDTGDENNKSTDVLHPCLDCRNMLRELKESGLVDNRTIICNANDTKKANNREGVVFEERNLKDFLELYKDDE